MTLDRHPDDVRQSVLGFWYGAPPDFDQQRKMWFEQDDAVDADIVTHFTDIHAAAERGELDCLIETPLGALALVIALDQFPRNMFRGSARAFATDAKARAVADVAMARGDDRDMAVLQKLFLYLPFEHSEDLADQERCRALFAATGNAELLDHAERHRVIIARFGRFPHRNDALGRVSTAEEIAFLKVSGSSF